MVDKCCDVGALRRLIRLELFEQRLELLDGT